MAKKQVATLTVEERLQQALVPESEQPYKLPDNWCWTKLGEVASLYTGNSINSKVKEQKYTNINIGIPYIGTKDISFDNEINYANGVHISDHEKFRKAPINTTLLCIEGGSAGKKIGFTTEEVCFGNKLCAFVCKTICSKLVYYYLQTKIFNKYFLNEHHGLIGGVSVNLLNSINMPLPPLAEQQRIVKRIEGLFAKLDEAKEKTQAALDSFETRKAAMLHKAFTGELTAKWRRENGVSMDSWGRRFFNDIADIKSNLVDPAKYMEFPHIAPDNIEKKTGVLLNYNTIYEDKVISGKHHFYPNQILYSKIRPYLSKVVIVDFEGLCSADMYPIEAKENRRYLWYFMLSEDFLEQASSAGSRSVLPKINQKELSKLSVSICLPKEQTEIVRILDSFFAKEQKAKEICTVLDNIDLIKKSILARAFRGELGTNDPNDESAVELLKIPDSKDIYEALVAKPQKLDNLIELEKMNLKKTILEVLNDGEVLTPEQLKLKTGLNIDDFYSELKILVDERKVRDRRENGESFLEVNNES